MLDADDELELILNPSAICRNDTCEWLNTDHGGACIT